jgi:hypothetical protein
MLQLMVKIGLLLVGLSVFNASAGDSFSQGAAPNLTVVAGGTLKKNSCFTVGSSGRVTIGSLRYVDPAVCPPNTYVAQGQMNWSGAHYTNNGDNGAYPIRTNITCCYP